MRKNSKLVRTHLANMAKNGNTELVTYDSLAAQLNVPASNPYFTLREFTKKGWMTEVKDGRVKRYKVNAEKNWWHSVLNETGSGPNEPVESSEDAASAAPISAAQLNNSWDQDLKELIKK